MTESEPHSLLPPTQITNICAFCHRNLVQVSLCGKCRKRKLCSRECQLTDWKMGHKKWCGRSCELGLDFAVRLTEDRGFAVFALREIQRGEKIIAEKPMMSILKNGSIVENEGFNRDAVMDLTPIGSTNLMEKFQMNAMSCNGAEEDNDIETGLFMLVARANHACLANTRQHFLKDDGVMILVASRKISIDEEITYQYINDFSSGTYSLLQSKWNFQCKCRACIDAEIGEAIRRVNELDSKILSYGRSGKYDMALRCGRSLIALYDKLEESPKFYERTYYDMFQVAVSRSSTLNDARSFLRLALEAHILFMGSDTSATALEYNQYLDNLSLHSNYLRG
jgi:hypothetical protein